MPLGVRGNAEAADEDVSAATTDVLRAEGGGGDGVGDSAVAADRLPRLEAMAIMSTGGSEQRLPT